MDKTFKARVYIYPNFQYIRIPIELVHALQLKHKEEIELTLSKVLENGS